MNVPALQLVVMVGGTEVHLHDLFRNLPPLISMMHMILHNFFSAHNTTVSLFHCPLFLALA